MDTITNRAELLRHIEKNPRLQAVYSLVVEKKEQDAAHDLEHLLRVALLAQSWTESQPPLRDLAIAAALLHDFVNLPKDHPLRTQASQMTAEKVYPFLARANFTVEEAQAICAAIRDHSYSAGRKPNSFLGEILQDADRLEALGAIGLMRWISTGTQMGAKYFHGEDPWAKKRTLNDKVFSLDHFFTKLLRLKETMHTEGGKKEAASRTAFMQLFLKQLGHEMGDEYASTSY